MDRKDLASVIKRSRNIMRKDAGLSTDVDRIPQFSWILFLKVFDDLERERQELNSEYIEAIKAPFRWRDWAADEEKGLTGNELIQFVNNELIPYLRGLRGKDDKDQRNIISEVFQEIYNNMRSGYLLKDIVDLINENIDFTSSDDIHTIAQIYENMLKEMRDAAGTNGEFYTPRPVIRFIIDRIKPVLGETILDPALGTGGFLIESYNYLKRQVENTQHREILQYNTLYGIEKKPMPYLLGTMNLLLHEIEKPNIMRDNSLRVNIDRIEEKDKVDIIVTNPPFGGEEEQGIITNFPSHLRTSETALLFLQLIMRRLHSGGRCGMIVPNGTLFASGVGALVKEELLTNFNLHTILRLPRGVFSPYSDIETNILFFEKTGKTKSIWFYEHPLPSERQKLKNPCYTKTKPLRYNEFSPIVDWWDNKVENDFAWKISIDDVLKYNEKGVLLSVNLDIKNPNKKDDFIYVSPKKIYDDIINNEKLVKEKLENIKIVMDKFEK